MLTVVPAALDIPVGGSGRATLFGNTDLLPTLTWRSNNEDIATVHKTDTGVVVTGASPGIAVVTAVAVDGKKGSVFVSVGSHASVLRESLKSKV